MWLASCKGPYVRHYVGEECISPSFTFSRSLPFSPHLDAFIHNILSPPTFFPSFLPLFSHGSENQDARNPHGVFISITVFLLSARRSFVRLPTQSSRRLRSSARRLALAVAMHGRMGAMRWAMAHAMYSRRWSISLV